MNESSLLLEKAKALVDKMEKIHASEAWKNVWSICYVHGYNYKGETYVSELKELKEVLNKYENLKEIKELVEKYEQ